MDRIPKNIVRAYEKLYNLIVVRTNFLLSIDWSFVSSFAILKYYTGDVLDGVPIDMFVHGVSEPNPRASMADFGVELLGYVTRRRMGADFCTRVVKSDDTVVIYVSLHDGTTAERAAVRCDAVAPIGGFGAGEYAAFVETIRIVHDQLDACTRRRCDLGTVSDSYLETVRLVDYGVDDTVNGVRVDDVFTGKYSRVTGSSVLDRLRERFGRRIVVGRGDRDDRVMVYLHTGDPH